MEDIDPEEEGKEAVDGDVECEGPFDTSVG